MTWIKPLIMTQCGQEPIHDLSVTLYGPAQPDDADDAVLKRTARAKCLLKPSGFAETRCIPYA